MYDTAFEVLSVYDGPIDGWFYVKWGRSAERRPKIVKCSCDPCTTPCKEDGVPESELLASAPDLLNAYKLTDQYAFRVAPNPNLLSLGRPPVGTRSATRGFNFESIEIEPKIFKSAKRHLGCNRA